MAIDINAFRMIANGEHNVGEICLNDAGTGLAKVNNHVYRTSLNNVRLTAEQNREVRAALVDALADAIVKQTPLRVEDPDFDEKDKASCALIGEIKDQLLGDGRDTFSLSRDYVRHLIAAATDGDIQDRLAQVQYAGRVGTKLLERTILFDDQQVPFSGRLVKSRNAAAYNLTVNETLDKAVVDARNALSEVQASANAEAPGEKMQTMTRAANTLTWGICTILEADPAVPENLKDNLKPQLTACIRQNLLAPVILISLANHPYMESRFIATFERQVRQIYQGLGLDGETVDRHMARILPKRYEISFPGVTVRDCYVPNDTLEKFGESAIELRQQYDRWEHDAKTRMETLKRQLRIVGMGQVNGIDALQSVRKSFLTFVLDRVLCSSAIYKTELCENIARIMNGEENENPDDSRANRFLRHIRDIQRDNRSMTAAELERELMADLDEIFAKTIRDNEIDPEDEWGRLTFELHDLIMRDASLIGLGI